MSYTEDAQPNERRQTLKGNSHVPVIRSTSRPLGPSSEGQRGRGGWRTQRGSSRYRGHRGLTFKQNPLPVMHGGAPHETPSGWHMGARREPRGRPFAGQTDIRRFDDPYEPWIPPAPTPDRQQNPLSLESIPSNFQQSQPWDVSSRSAESSRGHQRPNTFSATVSSEAHSSGWSRSPEPEDDTLMDIDVAQSHSPMLKITILPDSPPAHALSHISSGSHPCDSTETNTKQLKLESDPAPVDYSQSPNPSSTVLYQVPKFRSGTLRFKLPNRQVSDSPSIIDRHQGTSSLGLDGEQLYVHTDVGKVQYPSDMLEETRSPSHTVDAMQMRVDPHDKPRRLFVLPDRKTLIITMRGSIDLVEQTPLRCTALLSAAYGDRARPLLDDVCLLTHSDETMIVLPGRVNDSDQLSLVKLRDRKVEDLGSFHRPARADRKGGISVVTQMQPGMFVTGGYDHIVHTWAVGNDNRPVVSPPLAIKHSSAIHALLPIHDTSRKLLTGSADCGVSVYDMASERVVNFLKLSNSVYQVHSAPSPFCILLEIGHRELQFEVRDYRAVPSASVLRFGYPTTKVHGRYTRGAIQDGIFACGGGEKDGCVRLWDLRKPSEVLRTVTCFPGKKAIQVVFDGTQMVACSEDHQLVFVTHMGEERRPGL